MSNTNQPTIAVAGASGFIGRALPAVLGDDWRLIGLSRDPSRARPAGGDAYRWRRCDLFSRREARDGLAGADVAIYLVHSMMPSADLSQGEVADMDVICADNFARAAQARDVDHIVYVGAMTRTDPGHHSRADEVQSVLGAYRPALTTIRAGFVVGPGGAETETLLRLVARLPVMALPTWTSSRLWPIARTDLVELIAWTVAHRQRAVGTFEVGGPAPTTVRRMLATIAEITGRDRRFFRVPVSSPGPSARWISMVTGQPLTRSEPLVERLQHDLEPSEQRLQQMAGQQPTSIRAALRRAVKTDEPGTDPAPPVPAVRRDTAPARADESNVVRSVQRVVLPRNKTTRWVAREYARWLPEFMGPLVRATVDDGVVRFWAWRLPRPLLVLVLDDEICEEDHHLFWIAGGLLVAPHPEARLEFRKIPNRQAVLTAIHGYRPRLPWPIYVATQARIHHFVMHAFGRYLEGVDRAEGPNRR